LHNIFQGGGTGIIETNRLTPRKIRQLTVTGTNGVAVADYIDQSLKVHNGTSYQPKVMKIEPLKNELLHFIDCVENDTCSMLSCNGVEGIHALEVALAAISSYKNNRFEQVKNGYHGKLAGTTQVQ